MINGTLVEVPDTHVGLTFVFAVPGERDDSGRENPGRDRMKNFVNIFGELYNKSRSGMKEDCLYFGLAVSGDKVRYPSSLRFHPVHCLSPGHVPRGIQVGEWPPATLG